MRDFLRGPRRIGGSGGFTILELMVVVAMLLVVGVMGYPALNRQIHRARVMGFADNLQMTLAQARQEAVRRGVDVVVVPDAAAGGVRSFANVDGDAGLTYQPNSGPTPRDSDFPIRWLPLPVTTEVLFRSPKKGKKDGGPVEGLTARPSGDAVLVFQPDGSVRDTGSIFFADDEDNFFEARISPAATGKVAIRKYRENPPWGDADGYFEQGLHPTTGDDLWVWN